MLVLDCGVKIGTAIVEMILKPLVIILSTRYINCHYSSGYFNAMTAWYKIAEGKAKSNMRMITTENEALLQALSNMQNKDWRIIQLRECLVDKAIGVVLVDNAEMAAIKSDVRSRIEISSNIQQL